ncbi:MAG: glycosyltransferase family 9 protein [Kiritimatiellae bacterium]|nr:glycosyltransferase family 9 protein [Kiritimatiellia bacterium]
MDQPRPRVALAPVSRWPTKDWPAERFAQVAAALTNRCGASIFVIGARDAARAAQVIASRMDGNMLDLTGKTGLVETASVLAQMDLVISNDSGPMHMAAALGIPVLALFGPTDPVRTGPFGTGHRVLVAQEVACRPCFSRVCRFGSKACLAALSPEMVACVATEMLAQRKNSGRG